VEIITCFAVIGEQLRNHVLNILKFLRAPEIPLDGTKVPMVIWLAISDVDIQFTQEDTVRYRNK
jgi:hypothetical protein